MQKLRPIQVLKNELSALSKTIGIKHGLSFGKKGVTKAVITERLKELKTV